MNDSPPSAPPTNQRLVSVDALRGFDVCWILGLSSVVTGVLKSAAPGAAGMAGAAPPVGAGPRGRFARRPAPPPPAAGLPAEAADEDPARLLEQLIEQLRTAGSALRNERHQMLARGMARSMAIRSGRVLTVAEMHGLIDRLFACEVPTHTPAGKPVLVTYSLDELNQRFER